MRILDVTCPYCETICRVVVSDCVAALTPLALTRICCLQERRANLIAVDPSQLASAIGQASR
jgi:hypothetical protein